MVTLSIFAQSYSAASDLLDKFHSTFATEIDIFRNILYVCVRLFGLCILVKYAASMSLLTHAQEFHEAFYPTYHKYKI